MTSLIFALFFSINIFITKCIKFVNIAIMLLQGRKP